MRHIEFTLPHPHPNSTRRKPCARSVEWWPCSKEFNGSLTGYLSPAAASPVPMVPAVVTPVPPEDSPLVLPMASNPGAPLGPRGAARTRMTLRRRAPPPGPAHARGPLMQHQAIFTVTSIMVIII